MFEQEKVTNQNVYIKLAGAKSPVSLFVKEWTAAGVWVQSDDLHLELAQLANEQGIPWPSLRKTLSSSCPIIASSG